MYKRTYLPKTEGLIWERWLVGRGDGGRYIVRIESNTINSMLNAHNKTETEYSTADFVIPISIPFQCLVHFNITFPSSELLIFANANANIIDVILRRAYGHNLLHYSQFIVHIVL